jgi:chromosome partitioning protein
MILLVGGQKGGSGKTTLATNLACYVRCLGEDLILLDVDKQCSSTNWIQDRNENSKLINIPSAQASDNIKETISNLKTKYKHIIIDCAGRDSKEQRTGMLTADKFVIPIKPSQYDLDTLDKLSEIIDNAKDLNPKLKCFVLLSMCPTNPAINEKQQAQDFLKDFPEFNLLNAYTCERKIYRDTVSTGMGVWESDNVKAKQEIEKIAKELFDFK